MVCERRLVLLDKSDEIVKEAKESSAVREPFEAGEDEYSASLRGGVFDLAAVWVDRELIVVPRFRALLRAELSERAIGRWIAALRPEEPSSPIRSRARRRVLVAVSIR